MYMYPQRRGGEGPRPLDFHFSKVDFTRTVKKFIVVGEQGREKERFTSVGPLCLRLKSGERGPRPCTHVEQQFVSLRGAQMFHRREFLSRNRLHGQRRSEKTAGMRREIFETVQPCSSSLPNAQTDCPFVCFLPWQSE